MSEPFHDINLPVHGFGRKFETEEEEFERLRRTPSTSEKTAEFEKEYYAQKAQSGVDSNFSIHSLSWSHVDEEKKAQKGVCDGDRIRLFCGVDGCSEGTTIRFELYYKSGIGQVTQFQDAACRHIGTNASVELNLDLSKIKTTEEYSIYFNASAKSRYSSNCSIPLSLESDEIILFCPETNEYWEITDATDVDIFLEESAYMNEFAGKIQQVWQVPDAQEQAKAATELEKDFEGIIGDKQLAKGKRVFDELLVVKSNKRWGKLNSFVYVRKHIQDRNGKQVTIKKHTRKHSKSYMCKRLKEFLKEGNQFKNKPEYSVKAAFFKKEFDDVSAFKFVPTDTQTGEPQKDILKDSDYWSLGAEAQLLRYAAGASLQVDLTKIRKGELKVGGETNLTLSLAEGTIEGALHLPDKDGCNLLTAFTAPGKDKLNNLIEQGRECRVRFTAKLGGYVFLGASVTAYVGLPNIDFSPNPKTGSRNKNMTVGGEAKAGATATIGGTLTGLMEWKDHEEVNWLVLSSVAGRAEGSAGIAGELLAAIEYECGKFRIKLAAGAVLGIGGKLGVEIVLGLEEGCRFIGYILYSFDFHFVAEITKEAFEAFRDYSFVKMKEAGEVIEDAAVKAMEEVRDFGDWVGKSIRNQQIMHLIKQKIRTNINDSSKITGIPPETLGGQVLRTIMATVEKDDFDAIIKVLESAKSDHKLKWIIRCIVDYQNDDKGGRLLQEGINQLQYFGINMGEYKTYSRHVSEILNENGIIIR